MLINTEVIVESHDMVIHRKIKEGAWQSFIVFFNFFPRRGKFPFGWNGSRMALGSEYDRLKNFSPEIITEIELFLIKNYSNSENKYISNASVQDVAELTIKETNAVFSKNISAILSKISFFDEIKRLSNSCFYQLNLTGEVADKLHCDLNQGVLIIKTEWHLLKYMHAYGDMHQAKLKECFDVIKDLPTELNEKNIQIIDYGCGQGVGSIVFIDFLRSSNLTKFFIQKIILIEPSELALRNASLNVKYCLESISKNTNVLEVNKKIEQIDLHDLSTDPTSIKVHIFSNILDVDDFDIAQFAQKIDKSQVGINYFICVSPNISDQRNLRLDAFMNYFQQKRSVKVLSKRETNILDWTRYERIFKLTD